MFPLRTKHRDIEIRYGYNVATDDWRAHFVLPERQGHTGFQRTVPTGLSSPIAPGKHHVDGETESEAVTRAIATINGYLDDA